MSFPHVTLLSPAAGVLCFYCHILAEDHDDSGIELLDGPQSQFGVSVLTVTIWRGRRRIGNRDRQSDGERERETTVRATRGN